MAAITWLHLSDLHMNATRLEYDRDHVMGTLRDDLHVLAKSEPRPDLIVFSGDLAFGHTSEETIDSQFDMGFKFLDEIRLLWKPDIPKEKVFIVPGNHDVRRDLATPAITMYLESSKELRRVAALMKKQDKQWEQVIERLTPYREALKRHGYDHLLQNPKLLTFTHYTSIASWNLQICGLNTAWSCVGDQEKGKLWFCGRWQIAEVVKGPKPHISIGIMHHPPGWFREEEDIPGLERLLETSFTFLLHGHEHDDWVWSSECHVRIAGGTCYGGEDNENGYNLTSYDPTTGEGVVRLRIYDKKGRRWIQNIVGGRTDDKGHWHFRNGQALALLNGTQPISTALASAGNKTWDAFLAVPMASLSSAEYKEQRLALRKVIKTLRRDWGGIKVYYPAEHITGPDKWDPADMAMVRGLKAASSSRLFIMVYNVEKPSSILVEAGFALAHGIPSIYFVKKGLKLPFLLNAAGQAASDVKIYEYSKYTDIVAILKKYQEELKEFMRPSAAQPLLRKHIRA